VILARLIRYFDAPEFRNGGTGNSRGLGLAGAVLTAAVMLVSLVFSAAVTAALPSPPPVAAVATMGNAARPVGGLAAPTPRRAADGGPPAPRPARRRYDPRLPSQSGFLIQIK
jgi:hypothetical protein